MLALLHCILMICLLILLLFFEHACEVINEYDTAKLKIHTFRTVSSDHLHLQLL